MEINNQLFFCFCKKPSLQVRAKIISPTKPATLAASSESCKLRDSSPTALAIGEDEIDEFFILLGCPWTFLDPKFVTARLPSHTAHSTS
jgi:hypothetical protein